MKITLYFDWYPWHSNQTVGERYLTASEKPTMPKPDGCTRYKVTVAVPDIEATPLVGQQEPASPEPQPGSEHG